MKIIEGNLLHLAKDGKFDVIIHGCNCFCTMGAGIAKQIKQVFPAAFDADLATESGQREKLGTITWASIEGTVAPLIVVNAYTQYNWRGNGLKADYEAIRAAFKQVKTSFAGKKIGYPSIGAGLAGGDWEVISSIIKEELAGENHTHVIYKK